MKENKGITLIALIITIIVLIILAGITINLLMGEEGIINKANKASKTSIEAQADEQVELATLDMQLEISSNNIEDAVQEYNKKSSSLRKILTSQLTDDKWEVETTTTDDGIVNVKYIDSKYLEKNNGKSRNYEIKLTKNNISYKVLDGNFFTKNHYSKNTYATWFWNYESLITDTKSIEKFFDDIEEQKINIVYVCYNLETTVNDANYKKTLKQFAGEAFDRNVVLYWCNGDPGWILENHREKAIYSYIDSIVSYNNSVEDKYKIRGLHYDIEPHVLSDYEENKENYNKMYVEFARLAWEYAKDKNIKIEYDMHCGYNKNYYIDESGNKINVGEEIAKNCDQIVLMDYFSEIGSIFNALESSDPDSNGDNWIKIADKYNKNLIIGFDIEGFKNKYGEEFSREDYDEIMNDVIKLLKDYGKENNIDINYSFAAHEYNTIKTLKSSVVNYTDITNKNIGKRTTFKTQTGIEDIDNIKWNVLYADDNYTYLIANDYINVNTAAPKTSTNVGLTSVENNNYCGYMSQDLINCYNGDELDTKLEEWYTFGNADKFSRKAVSYMLDTEIWSKLYGKENDERINWVIGGPTIELFIKAYNEKYGENSMQYVVNSAGYNCVYYSLKGDGTFNISKTPDNNRASGKAWGMWFIANADSYGDNTMYTTYNNGLYVCYCDGRDVNYGFRPVICINRDK